MLAFAKQEMRRCDVTMREAQGMDGREHFERAPPDPNRDLRVDPVRVPLARFLDTVNVSGRPAKDHRSTSAERSAFHEAPRDWQRHSLLEFRRRLLRDRFED